ncbi:hypothetical protein Bca52824_065291 [Brassica carinata]|uniref:Uncharacterized protein n=1 Tax=Brassica carinata TaxID=52824 RepID=A0A8X7UAZ8_BRACI|nr:hypothetical protein Bca52824_065291 [Brassica carinata]
MVSTLIEEIRSQKIANQTIANRLEQAETELADHQAANDRERNQTSLDPLRSTSNPQNAGLFGTPEIPSPRSGRYTGENSQRPPPHGMTHRSLSYTALKNGVWFSSKFREELAVRAPVSLDDALHRASYFDTHEEEVAALKEQYSVNKNNATKKPTAPKEPTTKGKHSYAINNSPQNSSTYDLSKYCTFHDRKGHATEECRAALSSQNESKKTTEENGEEKEEPVTPKSNRKSKVSTNKRGSEIEQESLSSPPLAPKKRVDMISWGPSNNATNKTKSQTEGKIHFEISVAICTLENPKEATPPPRLTQYSPNTKHPCVKFSNFKRKNKMTKIRELPEKPIQKNDRMQTLNRNLSGGAETLPTSTD